MVVGEKFFVHPVSARKNLPLLAVLNSAGLLRPGAWRFSKDRRFVRHRNAGILPQSFRSVALHGQEGRRVRFSRPQNASILDSSFSADWLIIRQRTVLAVDSASCQVARINAAPYVSLDYEYQRARYSRWVPSAPFRVLPARIGIIEEIIDGQELSSVNAEERGKILAQFLESLDQVVRHEQAQDAGKLLELVCLASPLKAVRDRSQEIIQAFGHWPLVPTHCDLGEGHILVSSEGPFVIDFGNLRLGLPVEDTLAVHRMLGDDSPHLLEVRLKACAEAANVKFFWGRNFGGLLNLTSAALTLAAKGGIHPGRVKKTYAKWDKNTSLEAEALLSSRCSTSGPPRP